MDSTAISLCRDNNLPILVFNMTKPGNIRRVVLGEPLGTLVLDERRDPRLGPAARTTDARCAIGRRECRTMVNDIIKSLQGDIDKAIEAFQRDLGKVRTGRANLSILDGVRVDYYGTPTPLNQVASLNVADARLITVKPWERVADPRDREVDPRGAARPQPAVRRRAGAAAHAGAHRRSGARSWSRSSRRWPRSARSPCAARAATPTRCSRRRSRTRRSPRTTSARVSRASRRRPTRPSPRSTRSPPRKEAEILEV